MKVLVLGCGIIGVTTAYYAARDGHEVHVIDRQDGAAKETSFSNAGMIAPGHAYTWASPRAPKILWQSLFRNDTALRLKLVPDPYMWLWCWKFLSECKAERTAINTAHKLRLCRYSQSSLQALVGELGLDYHRVTGGALYLYRQAEFFDAGVRNMKILTDNGLDLQPVDAAKVVELEPALSGMRDRVAGAIYCPTDESGDCHVFAQRLAQYCADKLGVKFHWSTQIKRIEAAGDRIEKVATDRGNFTADAYVMALGAYAPILGRQIGLGLPVYPVKGYAMTIPIAGKNGAPRLCGVDEHNLVAWSRMGDRLRLTATAEFSGYDTSHKPSDFTHMLNVARELFPDGADYEHPSMWAGLRPMTPKGTPILGPSKHKNLWLNAGQGHMGWTMSFGSSKVVIDMMAGRKPAIDTTGLTLAAA
ncbi:MAG: D-amino acid dehydrogenase [Alphaproteobacteria bacterium]|nr:D-amino acid dehydrogenase [Alphaproteobacteria bacterium]